MKVKTKRLITRIISIALVCVMVIPSIFALTGCGKKEEEPQDVVTNITVTSDELVPELTDEDLGIVRKDPDDLSKVVGYQSWENYNFIVIKSQAGKGDEVTTIQIEDKDLFNSVYNARHSVYVDVDYSSVTPDDEMYAAYAKGLRSLGERFYSLKDGYLEEEETTPTVSESVEETTTKEVETAEATDEESEEEATSETEEATEETSEETETTSADEEELDELVAEDGDVMTLDQIKDGGVEENAEAVTVKKKLEELQLSINEYMESVSLYRANKVTIYAKDGELLGEMTPEKLNDYVKACVTEPTEYEATNGVIYTSDLESGVEYKVQGAVASESSEFSYTVKNDLDVPVVVYASSDSSSKVEYIFKNYMSTAKSQGWYLIEGQYDFVSTSEYYVFRVERKNSDADMLDGLDASKILAIDKLESKPIEVNSTYSAIVNNTDETVYLEADTGDSYTLGSKQAIGVHRAAYNTITYYFEGTLEIGDTLEEETETETATE